MKILNSFKFLPFFLVFINYELFLVFSVFFGIYVYLNKIKISKYRNVLNLSFLLFIILRILSAFDSRYKSFWESLSQKNYALDGKFIDMQSVFLAFNCNSVLDGEYLIFGTTQVVNCPHTVSYGPFFDIIGFKNNPLISTAVLTLLVFSALFIFYIKSVQSVTAREHYLFTLFALSPPVNFVLERMNFDIVVYIFVYLIFKYVENSYLKNSLLFLLVFMKFYPIFLIIGNTAYNFIKKNTEKFKIDLIFLVLSIYFLLYLNFIGNSIANSVRPFRPDRTFGLLSESLNYKNLYDMNSLYFYVMLIFLLLAITLYQKKYFKFSNILDDNFTFSITTMFLLLSLFANYDYRLSFMILISLKIINSPNRIFFYSYFFFIFSSPGILHSYGELFQLVENYQFFYIDIPFYFLISNLILEFYCFSKKNLSKEIFNILKNN